MFILFLFYFTGNSVRDESLHSSSTQKHSLESFSTSRKYQCKNIHQQRPFSDSITSSDNNTDHLTSYENHSMASATNLTTNTNQITTESINNYIRKYDNKYNEIPFHNSTIEYSKNFKCDQPNLHQQTIINYDPIPQQHCINNSTFNIAFNTSTSSDAKLSPNYQVIYNEEGEFEISIDKHVKNVNSRNNFANRLLNIFKTKKRRFNNFSPPTNANREPMKEYISSVNETTLANEKQTTFMRKMSMSSLENVISNSSLKDFDGQELADELNLYMEELKRRELR